VTGATTPGAATASAPDPSSAGRLEPEAARARTEELFHRHGRLVTGLCRGLLRNADEAEDAAQQAFLSAHGAFLRGAEPRDPAAWVATIARNECLARIRERMRRPLPVAGADTAVSSSDPVAEATRRADMAALWRAVGALAPLQREAMLLREFGGLSYDELAVALGVSVPAVESLLFRARTKLRLELKTIAAALGGLLPRLLAGGGAAKVAGLTVAAGIVTGGVVATDRAPHTPPPPRPHHALVVPPIVQRRDVAVTPAPTPARTTTRTPAREDRMRESDVAAHEGGRDRTTVVEPTETPSLTTDGGSRDMSGDATTTTQTTTITATTATTTTESGHDGGTDGASSDGGDGGTTTTSSGEGPHS
jgi:RNA polymerase sigma factor (sigma-70 family)